MLPGFEVLKEVLEEVLQFMASHIKYTLEFSVTKKDFIVYSHFKSRVLTVCVVALQKKVNRALRVLKVRRFLCCRTEVYYHSSNQP